VADRAQRQAYAIARPINNVQGVAEPALTAVDELRDGNLLLTILAVDR